MREIDEMSTSGFWAEREARLRKEAQEEAEYALSPEGIAEAARREANYQAWLGPQKPAGEENPGLDAETESLFAKYIGE